MSTTKPLQPGALCWADLATSDVHSAKEFYSGLFGWELSDEPMGDAGTYTLCRIGAKDVVGIYAMQEAQAEGPPRWNTYFSVTTADDAAAKARDLGATLLMEPFDVMDVGRGALVQDPTGGVFWLWQSKRGEDIVTGLSGALGWAERGTRYPECARRFYSELFGWQPHDQEMGELGTYTIFREGDDDRAGMYRLTEQHGDMPAYWQIYFTVDDCDKTADAVGELGGKVLVPPTDIPGGRFALALDPQGAPFGVHQYVPGS